MHQQSYHTLRLISEIRRSKSCLPAEYFCKIMSILIPYHVRNLVYFILWITEKFLIFFQTLILHLLADCFPCFFSEHTAYICRCKKNGISNRLYGKRFAAVIRMYILCYLINDKSAFLRISA